MKKICSFLTALFILCMLFAPASNAATYSNMYASPTSLTYNWDQTSGYFFLYTSDPWVATNSVSGWLRFEGQGYGGYVTGTGSSTIWFTMDKNTSEYSRTGYFIIYNLKTNESVTVTVTQKGIDKNSILQITKNISTTYDFRKQSVTLKFKSVDSWKIKSDKSFVTFSKTSGSGSSGEQSVVITIDKNNETTSRKAKITLTSEKYGVSIDINITQSGAPEFYDSSISGVTSNDYNYYISPLSNTFYVSFTATVPWRFSSDLIQASITEGGPGTYTIRMTLPRYDVSTNPIYGFQGAFIFKEKYIPITVFYSYY